MNSRLLTLLAVLALVAVCLIDTGSAQYGYGWRRRMWGGYPGYGYGGMGCYGMGNYGMGMGG